MYDCVIVTHIPAFYKVNLYEQLSRHLKIYVLFIAENTSEVRANDFTKLSSNLEYEFVNGGDFQSRSLIKSLIRLKTKLATLEYKSLLISGWDLPEFWYLAFTNRKKKISLALESSSKESSSTGLKSFIKRVFLSRVPLVFASGKAHASLLNLLGYKGEVAITHGVGIINKSNLPVVSRVYKKRFLFIGRLTGVKNLDLLINVFNDTSCTLTIIGDGPKKKALQDKSSSNITYLEKVDNHKLEKHLIEHDMLVLGSLSEPWGLVVEEALYYGLPVVISENCGAAELIKDGYNGYLFDPIDAKQLKNIVNSIDQEKYSKLVNGVMESNIDKKDTEQIKVYLEKLSKDN